MTLTDTRLVQVIMLAFGFTCIMIADSIIKGGIALMIKPLGAVLLVVSTIAILGGGKDEISK